jgi:hypothetical protein
VSLHHNHLIAPRASVPGIANISGPHATATMAAWVKIGAQQGDGGFIGGVWDESHAWRQFALFVDLAVCGHIPNGTVAHISGAGGPEAGRQYCQSAACGTTNLGDGKWHCIANVYNSTDILAYVDGELDNHGDPEEGPRQEEEEEEEEEEDQVVTRIQSIHIQKAFAPRKHSHLLSTVGTSAAAAVTSNNSALKFQ